MFCAGMETDINELKRTGKASFLIALLGVIIPLVGGFGIAYIFNRPELLASDAACSLFLQNAFIGVILTATSVSITVETLKELGKLKTTAGNTILGAAVIDDILGIIALTIITSMADSSVQIGFVLLKIVGFFVFAIVAGFCFYKFYRKWSSISKKGLQRHTIMAFVFCLLMSYIAERFFGVADITGAYIAGIILSMTEKEPYLACRFNTLSYLYLSPIFFASIGLKVVLPEMSTAIVAFAVILTVVAMLTKLLGCGLGAKICHYTNKEAVQIGIGMISRGEVALIIASKGAALGLMSSALMGPVIIMVVITTTVTPILLKPVFKDKNTSTDAAV
jgi:Kef-type K+ transport system membrane component KefB